MPNALNQVDETGEKRKGCEWLCVGGMLRASAGRELEGRRS